MNCGEIDELMPLWLSGELAPDVREAFALHLAGCRDCAAELREQRDHDAGLRDAMEHEAERDLAVSQGLEATVMGQIGQGRSRRLAWPAFAVAAAAVAAAVLATAPKHTPANPAIFADAARDHAVEVIRKGPRHWRTEPAEISALETAQGISATEVQAVEATGYRLQRAKICRLGGKAYLHLVYAQAGREFSVYMRVRSDSSLPDDASAAGSLQLASFTRGRVQAVIVTDAPRGDCARFARDAKAAL